MLTLSIHQRIGSLSVEKKYEGDALKDKTFGFTVKVDLTGGDYYDSYKLNVLVLKILEQQMRMDTSH